MLLFEGSAYAQRSGLLLGITYTKSQARGLYVQRTLPGYSADGLLRRGDVLLRIADEDYRIYDINSGTALENAKIAIGQTKQAEVEVRRRYSNGSTDVLHFRVTFQPIEGIPADRRVRSMDGGTAVAEFSESDGSFFRGGNRASQAGSFFRGR